MGYGINKLDGGVNWNKLGFYFSLVWFKVGILGILMVLKRVGNVIIYVIAIFINFFRANCFIEYEVGWGVK